MPQRFQLRLYETVSAASKLPRELRRGVVGKGGIYETLRVDPESYSLCSRRLVLYADSLMIDFEASHSYSPGTIQGRTGGAARISPGIPINLLIDPRGRHQRPERLRALLAARAGGSRMRTHLGSFGDIAVLAVARE